MIGITLRWFIAVSYGHFWLQEKFENVANPDFKISSTCKTWDIFFWVRLVYNLVHKNFMHFSITGTKKAKL